MPQRVVTQAELYLLEQNNNWMTLTEITQIYQGYDVSCLVPVWIVLSLPSDTYDCHLPFIGLLR